MSELPGREIDFALVERYIREAVGLNESWVCDHDDEYYDEDWDLSARSGAVGLCFTKPDVGSIDCTFSLRSYLDWLDARA